MPLTKRDFSLGDLYVAYRKAKVDAYFENTHPQAIAFTDYEKNLHRNLLRLHRALIDPATKWASDLDFLGGYSYMPKAISHTTWGEETGEHFRALDPLTEWSRRFKQFRRRAEASLRLIIRPTVDFQVISALWIIKVGHLFDGIINPKLSFGNRLRRAAGDDQANASTRSSINLAATGLFVPYFTGYREWRETGLSEMEKALAHGKDILAVTMDIEQFYHRVSPSFALRKRFLNSVGLNLSTAQRSFTKLLLTAIETWYRATPDYKDRPAGAIPVGLSASKVLANVLLADFDNAVVKATAPLYYGRYVDDIFIVFENRTNITGAPEAMKWIANSLRPAVTLKGNDGDTPSLQLRLPYARDSYLIFAGIKQKIFSLSSKHGLDLIQHIRDQMRLQSSEYRLLPVLPETSAEMASRALLATPDATLQVDTLRKADVVSVRRLGLSLLLSDIEVHASDLVPRSWIKTRDEFYGLVNRHAITPVGFFEFFTYLPRVFGLMISCGDFATADRFISDLEKVAKLLEKTSTLGQRPQKRRFELCLNHYAEMLKQSGLQAATERSTPVNGECLAVLQKLKVLDSRLRIPSSLTALKQLVHQILLADWGKRPYKNFWYLTQSADELGPPVPKSLEVRRKLRLGGIRRFRKLAGNLRVPHWPAFAFPTRPLRPDEISLVAPGVLLDHDLYKSVIMVLRGAQVVSMERIGVSSRFPPSASISTFTVPGTERPSITIAITSYKTTEAQWARAARGREDRSPIRYKELNELINRVLREAIRPDYIIFPELSIPLRWALRVARKLALNNVSLLAGVEYHRDKKTGRLRNDCLVSLVTSWPGYPSHIVHLQPKFAPAHNERIGLQRLGIGPKDILFQPPDVLTKPIVYIHKGHCFSVLICSDLTDIRKRALLRGEIDTLFIMEWNSDVKTFSSLVEATANDLHSFVVQANNRLYGDSRVRAPAKTDYLRDIVQVKGGVSDFYVLGQIDYLSLRREQRGRASKPLFKPTPIGFKMSDHRRRGK